MELKLVHEDDRRALYELGEGGNWKVCKYIEAKEQCVLGNHYHKNKDELFLLVKGRGCFYYGSEHEGFIEKIEVAPFSLLINRDTYHTFVLDPGSILICLASELHDPKDDYKIPL